MKNSLRSEVILELIEDAGLHADRLIAAGGGTRNPLLMQAKADMTGRCFILSQQQQQRLQARHAGGRGREGTEMPRDFSGEGSRKEADIERKTAAPRKEYGEACLAKYKTYLALTEAAAREGTKERQEFLWN
ncbi:MAG: hypothetical protein ACLVAW_13580 [Eisenbergiella massiliensis]